MNAEGIREIAKMQCTIDSYDYFLNNLYQKLKSPNKEVICIVCNNEISQMIWEEVEKLQNQVKNER